MNDEKCNYFQTTESFFNKTAQAEAQLYLQHIFITFSLDIQNVTTIIIIKRELRRKIISKQKLTMS